jgi:cell wall-associated NlpC family hydrolase
MSRCLARIFVIAITVASSACATTGGTPRPFPSPAPPVMAPVTPAAAVPAPPPMAARAPRAPDLGYGIAGTALNLRGTPYRNGGADPAGFDCSGLVKYVFAQNGIQVPRTVGDQFHAGSAVDAQRLEPGDLVFFTTVAPGASHVGIAIGGDEFVHAPSMSGEVRVERLSGPYWSTRFVGARRVL